MAGTRACLVVLVVALAFQFMHGATTAAPVGTAARSSSVQRRRQARNLLKRLNKTPLASIQSPDGDIIDCVPISKQPAFDHPLLKNHTIQMWPSYFPKGMDHSSIEQHPFTQTWHQNGKCPDNTIPIRRTKEEEVLRASSIERYGKKRPRSIPEPISSNNDPDATVTVGHLHAVASSSIGKYYGTKTTFNLWQPKTETSKDFSLAQLWIVGGSYNGNDLNTVEAGWQVCQYLYGDNNSRLFIFWTSDAYQRTGCYNLICPGFVQISNNIAISGSISPVSIYGGSQYDFDVLIWKDPGSGNWWMKMGTNLLGYWPSSIFSHLANSASIINWGGEVYSPNGGQTSTQMGSGHFPGEGFGKASYIRNILVVDSSNALISPSGVVLGAQKPNYYNVQNGTNSSWGTYIYYGGPGKNLNCQ